MRCIDQLKERLKGKTAEEAIDALAAKGSLDDHLARRFIVVEEFEQRYGNTDRSARSVQEDIAEEMGVCRRTVGHYLGQ